MVINKFVKCKYCNTKYDMRLQLGISNIDTQFVCAKCKVKIKCNYDCEKNILNIINADEINDQNYDYKIELSSEFLTNKARKFSLDIIYEPTPFIRNVENIDSNSKEVFEFAKNIKYYKCEFNDVYSLYNNKSYGPLKRKLKTENNDLINVIRNSYLKIMNYDFGLFTFVCGYQTMLLSYILKSDALNEAMLIKKEIFSLYENKKQQVVDFIRILERNNVIEKNENRFIELSNQVLDCFTGLIPLIICKDINKYDFLNYGINTIDVDELSVIYKNCFEYIGENSIYIIGLNNIFERGACNNFNNKIEDIYECLKKIIKYLRIQDYIKEEEKFSKNFISCVDNIIRNSEGHFSTSMDYMTQMITFVNKKPNGDEVIKEMYLAEFAIETLNIFRKAFYIWHMNNCLKEIKIIRN